MSVPATITPVPVTAGIGTNIGAIQDAAGNVYQGVSQYSQISQLFTLQENAVANGDGNVFVADGLDGTLNLFIDNGAGTCTVTVYGSRDDFATLQSWQMIGVNLLASNSAGTPNPNNIQPTLLTGTISVAANTSYVYQLATLYPYILAVISNASGLGNGTYFNGCSVYAYGVPL